MKKLIAFIGALGMLFGAFGGTASADPVFFVYTQPHTPASPDYTAITCAIDISSIPDFTVVNSVTGCGVTVSFSSPMEKRTVPGSWATWGQPPDTESAGPAVLATLGDTSVTLTYGGGSSGNAGRRTAGLEAEPNPFSVHSISAVYKDGGGNVLGTITRDIDGNAGARLLAARTKDSAKIKSVTVSSDAAFAIGTLRV